MQRSRVEIDNEIEAIIRDQYTALHPSVEWKFVESAFDLLQRRKKEGDAATVQPIVFKDVLVVLMFVVSSHYLCDLFVLPPTIYADICSA